MSTQIKLDGVWVTVAGGHRMWVGTKEARDAALAAGKLPDGTEVMTINDYTPPAEEYVPPTPINLPQSGARPYGTLYYEKIGKVVHLYSIPGSMFMPQQAATGGDYLITAIVPVGARPKISNHTGWSVNALRGYGPITISPNGNIDIHVPAGSSSDIATYMYIDTTYIAYQ